MTANDKKRTAIVSDKERKNNYRFRDRHKPSKELKAPNDVHADVVTSNWKSYNKFKKKYVGFSRNETRNTISDYQAVIKALNEFYINYTLDTGKLVILPNGMGKLGVRKFKKAVMLKENGMYNLKVDMNALNTTGEVHYYTNAHTDGNSFKWMWIKSNSRLTHRGLWKFKPMRTIQLKLAGLLQQEGYDWDKYHYMTDKKKEVIIKKRVQKETNAGL